MRNKKYIDTLKWINEQIAKYLENGFTPFNPKEHMFELIGRRNKLTYSINIEQDLKAFKDSGCEYRLLYINNLNDLLFNKKPNATKKQKG